METIGSYLKQQREKAGMSIDSVASVTRIRGSILKDIEEGRLESVPSGVFLRGFVRSYAEAIRIKPDRALEVLDSHLLPEDARSSSRVDFDDPDAPRPHFRISHLLIIVTALLAMMAAYYLTSNPHPGPAEVSAAQTTDVDSGTTRSFSPRAQRD